LGGPEFKTHDHLREKKKEEKKGNKIKYMTSNRNDVSSKAIKHIIHQFS
jgi:hypothetical protein